MHDGTVKGVRMYIVNIPEKTSSGKIVSSGSMYLDEIAKERRGWFNLHGENKDQVEAVVPTSGPFGFFFKHDDEFAMSMRLLDEKGNFPDGQNAIVPEGTCFCENPGQSNQFSELVISSKQGKEQGLGPADESSGVVTLRSRFLKDPEVYRCISNAVTRGGGGVTRGGGLRGPPEKSYNCQVGFGAHTGTTWTTSNKVAACEVKTVTFRIKVAQRETQPVHFASTWEEAQKKYGPPKFVPDESSDDDETSSDDKKRKSDDDGMSDDDEKPESDEKRKRTSEDDQSWRLLY